MEKIACETREEYDALKQKAMMAKVVLLDRKGEHPLMNPSLFNGKKKKQFLGELSELMLCDTNILTEQFNDVVNHNILAGGADVSQYPIYQTDKSNE